MKKTSFALAVLFLTATVSLQAQVLKPSDAESKVAFIARNMGMDVNGTFSGLKGTITINKTTPDKSNFDVTVEVATIKTGIDKRDAHLKTSDFLMQQNTRRSGCNPNGSFLNQATLTMRKLF